MRINLDVSLVIEIALLFLVQEWGEGRGTPAPGKFMPCYLVDGGGRELFLCLLYLSCLCLKLILRL